MGNNEDDLEQLFPNRIALAMVVAVTIATTLLCEQFAWYVMAKVSMGEIHKAKSEKDTQLECVVRARNHEDTSNEAFRIAIEACIPPEAK